MPAPRGSRNGASKLTEEMVRDIRRRHRPFFNTRQLAAEYQVSTVTINAIANREIWGWLEDQE